MHVKATVGAGDVVTITLPTFQVLVCREDAVLLRAALNAILPERIDLVHDPRVTDMDLLNATRSILSDEGLDTESIAQAQHRRAITADLQADRGCS